MTAHKPSSRKTCFAEVWIKELFNGLHRAPTPTPLNVFGMKWNTRHAHQTVLTRLTIISYRPPSCCTNLLYHQLYHALVPSAWGPLPSGQERFIQSQEMCVCLQRSCCLKKQVKPDPFQQHCFSLPFINMRVRFEWKFEDFMLEDQTVGIGINLLAEERKLRPLTNCRWSNTWWSLSAEYWLPLRKQRFLNCCF